MCLGNKSTALRLFFFATIVELVCTVVISS